MLQCGVTGAVPYGSVGPKMATIGRPTAAATCIAPESLPMKRWHCDSSAGRSAIPVFPVRSIGGRLISAAIAAETVASAAVPKRITSAPVSLCKRFATSAKREGGQHFADPYEAPAPIAVRSAPWRTPYLRRNSSALCRLASETCRPMNDSSCTESSPPDVAVPGNKTFHAPEFPLAGEEARLGSEGSCGRRARNQRVQEYWRARPAKQHQTRFAAARPCQTSAREAQPPTARGRKTPRASLSDRMESVDCRFLDRDRYPRRRAVPRSRFPRQESACGLHAAQAGP